MLICSKVHIPKEIRVDGQVADGYLRLDWDLSAIEIFLKQHPKTRLIVIDPTSKHMGNVSMVDEKEVRRVLGPMKEVAILCVMHLNKKEGLSAINRVGGAGAFIGVAGASWLFTEDPRKRSQRLMLPLKNNYADASIGLVYELEETPVSLLVSLISLGTGVSQHQSDCE